MAQNQTVLMSDAHEYTDAELAALIRSIVCNLNDAVHVAARRELVVGYRIKYPDPNNGPHNPKLSVTIMTEVA